MNLCNKSFSILFINEDLFEIDGNCVNKIRLLACLYSLIHIRGAGVSNLRPTISTIDLCLHK